MAPYFKICFAILAINLKLINGSDNKLSMLSYDTNVAILHSPKTVVFQSQRDLSVDINTLVNLFNNHYDKDELDFKLDDITIERFNEMADKIADLPKYIGQMGQSHVENNKLICAINLDGLKAKLDSLLNIAENALKKGVPMQQNEEAKAKRDTNSERAIAWINGYHDAEYVPPLDLQEFYEQLIFYRLSKLTNTGLDSVIEDLENEGVLTANSINRRLRKSDKLIKIQTLLAEVHKLELPVKITRARTRFSGIAQTFIDRTVELNDIQTDDRIQKLTELFTELRDNGNMYSIPILDRISAQYDLPISNEPRELKVMRLISLFKQKFELPDEVLNEITIGGQTPGQKRNRMDEITNEHVTKRTRVTSEQPTILENDIDIDSDTIDLRAQDEKNNLEDNREQDQSARDILDSDLTNEIIRNDNDNDNDEIIRGNEEENVEHDLVINREDFHDQDRMVSDEPTLGNDVDGQNAVPKTNENTGPLLDKIPLLVENDVIIDGRVDSNSAAVIKQVIDSVLLHDLPNLDKKFTVSELSDLCDYQKIYYVEYSAKKNDALVYIEKILGSKLKPVPFCSEQFCHELQLSHINIDLITGQTCLEGKQLDANHYICEAKLQLDRHYCDRTHTPTTECVFTQYEKTDEVIYFNHNTALFDQKTNHLSQNVAENEFDITINGTKYTLQPKSRAFLTAKKEKLEFFLTKKEIALDFDKPATIIGQVRQILATIPQIELIANIALGVGSLAGLYSLMQLVAFIFRKMQEIFSSNPNPRGRRGAVRAVYELGTRGLRRIDNTEIE